MLRESEVITFMVLLGSIVGEVGTIEIFDFVPVIVSTCSDATAVSRDTRSIVLNLIYIFSY